MIEYSAREREGKRCQARDFLKYFKFYFVWLIEFVCVCVFVWDVQAQVMVKTLLRSSMDLASSRIPLSSVIVFLIVW